ncbi:MAG: maltose ABC transporter permease MalG [Halanaerobiales bacterium]|nr:maltose ABC transporter permease MalG [Halanaerobiales bacterium]
MYRKPTFASNLIRHLVIWLVLVFALFPVIWIISGSFNPANTLVGQKLIPEQPSWVNYRALINSPQHPFPLWMWNSIKIALITSILAVAMTSLAAYAFSRFRFRGRRNGLFVFLLIQVFPQLLAMVAIYLLFLEVQKIFPAFGLNTHRALIITYLGGAIGVNTWLMKGYLDTIPRSLEEAAYIDGASPFQAFYRIILPLARPILAVLFFLQFIGIYSEFVLARVLLSSKENLTLAVGLQTFISEQYGKRWGVFSAAALLGAIPIVLLFFLVQKHIVSGLNRGGVKG